jgi:hypothetical protein
MKEQNEEYGNYFVIFPLHLMDKLSAKRCVLIGILLSLAKKEGYAYVSNSALSKIMRCSIEMIQKDLMQLEGEGYIKRDVILDSNNQVVFRKIYPLTSLVTAPIVTNSVTLTSEVTPPPPQKLLVYKDKDINIKDKIKYTNDFESVWDLYCKKGNKVTSYKSWQRLSAIDKQDVMSRIADYVNNHKEANKLEFLPHLSTYLNQQRWKDSLPYEVKNKKLDKFNINWG